MSAPLHLRIRLQRNLLDLARDVLLLLNRKGTVMGDLMRAQLRREPNEISQVLRALEGATDPLISQVGKNGPWRLTQAGQAWVAADRASGEASGDDPVELALTVARDLAQLEIERDKTLEQVQATIEARTADVESAARMLGEAQVSRDEALAQLDEVCEQYDLRATALRGRLKALLPGGAAARRAS